VNRDPREFDTRHGFVLLAALLLAAGCGGGEPADTEPAGTGSAAPGAEPLRLFPGAKAHEPNPGEVRLSNLRQLTFGGENAEAYWSSDGRSLIFQFAGEGVPCDQIYVMNLEDGAVNMVSTGQGRTTCAYLFPGAQRLLYSSTHLASPDCPPPADYSRGYVWKLYESFDVFSAAADGSDVRRLTDTPGYDAEATVSTDGERIIFTSVRDGDLDLYTMNADGGDVRRITDTLGYDGGAFFSRDGKRIVWRASRPETPEEQEAYRELLRVSQIRPMNLEVFVADADGSNARQVTDNGAANFGPYFFPDGKRIIFASNMAGGGRNFELFMINDDGSGLEQVTFEESFDGFPMFSPDGTKLVFASNRHGAAEGNTNLFIADWVD
jgi:Tol biopolymer transport system component